MRPSKPASVLLSLVLALLVLSFSISVPILFRPFYYVQIDALHLPEQTGWSAEVIREAYDEVLDFCVFGAPFGTGELAWSESGRSHFADVRGLFLLDFAVLGVTAAAAAGFLLLYKQGAEVPPLRRPGAGLLGGDGGCGGGAGGGRTGDPGLRPGLCGVPRHLLPGQGQLDL